MLADKTLASAGAIKGRRAGAIKADARAHSKADARAQLKAEARALSAAVSNQRPVWPGGWPAWLFGLKLGQQISLGLHHPGRASSHAHDGALLYFISI